MVRLAKGLVFFAVATHKFQEHCTEQCEYQCLHEADEKFHKVEWQSGQEGKILRHQCHQAFKSLLATIDITEETEAERYWTDENGHDLENTNEKEHDDHADFHEAGECALRGEDVSKEVFYTDLGE